MSLFAGLEEKVNVLMDLISQLKEENKNLIKYHPKLQKNILSNLSKRNILETTISIK